MRGRATRHSQQEWIWRRDDYAALFAEAPPDALRLESTPFYLYLAGARRRIAEELPDARLLVVIRDPIDRAYSNWMHLWVDGLEPIGDFVDAWHAEDERVAAGWAPFWHYRRLGRYGEQLADLLDRVDRERVLVLRYWQLVSQPVETLNRVARFLGIAEDQISTVPPDNSRPFVRPGLKTTVLGRAIRGGGRRRPALPTPGLARGQPTADHSAAAGWAEAAAAPGSGATGGLGGRVPGRYRPARAGARRVLRGLALAHRSRLLRRAEGCQRCRRRASVLSKGATP